MCVCGIVSLRGYPVYFFYCHKGRGYFITFVEMREMAPLLSARCLRIIGEMRRSFLFRAAFSSFF